MCPLEAACVPVPSNNCPPWAQSLLGSPALSLPHIWTHVEEPLWFLSGSGLLAALSVPFGWFSFPARPLGITLPAHPPPWGHTVPGALSAGRARCRCTTQGARVSRVRALSAWRVHRTGGCRRVPRKAGADVLAHQGRLPGVGLAVPQLLGRPSASPKPQGKASCSDLGGPTRGGWEGAQDVC